MGIRSRRADVLAPAMRRLDGVRVTVADGHARAEVYGIGHRHPVTIPVSMALATRLVAQGAPVEICHEASMETSER
jgi:hypothetical protein